jgi:hypothetical protein
MRLVRSRRVAQADRDDAAVHGRPAQRRLRPARPRARHIRKTTAATTAIDLLGDTIVGITAHRVWSAAVQTSRCQAFVATLPSYADLELVQMTPGRLWWAHSTAADFGGSESEFVSATVGRNCSIGEPQMHATFPELDWSSGSFAVDGQTIFVAGRDTGGIVSALIG